MKSVICFAILSLVAVPSPVKSDEITDKLLSDIREFVVANPVVQDVPSSPMEVVALWAKIGNIDNMMFLQSAGDLPWKLLPELNARLTALGLNSRRGILFVEDDLARALLGVVTFYSYIAKAYLRDRADLGVYSASAHFAKTHGLTIALEVQAEHGNGIKLVTKPILGDTW